jgi:hypothetical protein
MFGGRDITNAHSRQNESRFSYPTTPLLKRGSWRRRYILGVAKMNSFINPYRQRWRLMKINRIRPNAVLNVPSHRRTKRSSYNFKVPQSCTQYFDKLPAPASDDFAEELLRRLHLYSRASNDNKSYQRQYPKWKKYFPVHISSYYNANCCWIRVRRINSLCAVLCS